MAINITQLAGGKTTSRIIYMEYADSGGVGGYAKLKWPAGDTKPTLITTTTSENILDVIQAANPAMTVQFVGLKGATDYGSCFFGFWDDVAEESWTAEIGSSAFTTEGPIWGNNDWCRYAYYVGPGGCFMNGGMSSSTSELITGLGIGGAGWINPTTGEEYSCDVRAAVYTGGSLSDPTGATLLWDAGIISMEPGDYGSRWEVAHPGGGVTLPANTPTWICLKFAIPGELPAAFENTNLYINVAFDASALPVDFATAGDFQNNRGTFHLNVDPSFLDVIECEVVDDHIDVAFPGAIPAGGIWDADPAWKSHTWGWSIAYVKLAEEAGSSSISEAADPEASGWKFLRLISQYAFADDLSAPQLKQIGYIDTCENNVYMVTPNTAVVSNNFSDDFTGDNGDPPNSRKWDIVSGVPEIQNNKLELTQIGAAGIPDIVKTSSVLSQGYAINCNAEVTVDFELINYAAVESWWIGIFMYSGEYIDPSAYTFTACMKVGWWNGEYNYQLMYGGRTSVVGIGGAPPTSGKLKLVQFDNNIYGYYWGGADWVLVGDSTATGFGPEYTNFRLQVDNLTAGTNITWRADNFTMKVGNGNYCAISVFANDSYNSTTKKFETLTNYKNTGRYWSHFAEVYPIAAGTGGCAVQVYKGGFYWYDQPYLCYYDLVTYDDDLNLTNQSNYNAEYALGEFCGWQRDIYDPIDMLDNLEVQLMCGSYPDHLFIVGTTFILDGAEGYQGLIELNATTLRPIRISVLQTTDLEFDGSEIQDAIAIP